MGFSNEELQAANVAFGLAARLVQIEPDRDWVAACMDQDLFDESPFGGEDEAVAHGLELLRSWCKDAQGDIEESTASIQREWLRLFIGLGMPEASISESFYTEASSMLFSRNTLSVREIYREWGLKNENSKTEPDDTLGMMLLFCSHLMQVAAQGQLSGDGESAGKALSALEDFLVNHMLPWVPAWRFLVANHAKTGYYLGVGELVFGLERACAAKFGIVYNEDKTSFSYVNG